MMDSIPFEIRDSIVGHIAGPYEDELAPYATLNREWQSSVEQRTFRDLSIQTTDLDAFAAMYQGQNIARIKYLAVLRVTFILPSPSAPGCCPVERKPNRKDDSAAFSGAVAKLFRTLANLETQVSERQPLSMTFMTAYRMSKFEQLYNAYAPCYDAKHSWKEIERAEASFGYFHLLEADSLQSLRGLTSLEFMPSEDLQDLDNSWIPKLVQKLPDLQRLALGTLDKYSFGRKKRQSIRKGIVYIAFYLAMR
jgi:hypothetical protein